MKKLIALILVCLLCLGTTALAAEWAEGLGPGKPYEGAPEMDLSQSIGHLIYFPSVKLPAEVYCDVLEIYMPNPDIALGEGTITLWDEDGAVCTLDFANADEVELRQLEEIELEDLMWGSGVCVDIHLPVSLEFDKAYYVTLDEGVLTSNGGDSKNRDIYYEAQFPIEEQIWSPLVTSDYGISKLYYSAAPAEEEETEEEAAEEAELAYIADPGAGDLVNFDVVLGGDANLAILSSQNNSVYFDTLELSESGHVVGTITDADVSFTVVFAHTYEENGEEKADVVDYITLGKADLTAAAE